MMLDSQRLRTSERQGVRGRDILRMRIVQYEQFLGTNFIHRDQVLNGFSKCAERLVIPQVPDVLAHECLCVHNECDRVF